VLVEVAKKVEKVLQV